MSTRYVCDWCGDEHADREQVANADVTIGAVNERLHLCVECAPDHLRQHYPDKQKKVTDGGHEFYVVNEDQRSIVGGPYSSRVEAQAADAAGQPAHIVVSERALRLARQDGPIRDETDDVDVVSDGGTIIVCPECDCAGIERRTDAPEGHATDGGSIVEDELPDHLTTMQTLGGTPLLRCLRCGSEGATEEDLNHRGGCPAPTGGEQ
jgi:hypothetical protein